MFDRQGADILPREEVQESGADGRGSPNRPVFCSDLKTCEVDLPDIFKEHTRYGFPLHLPEHP